MDARRVEHEFHRWQLSLKDRYQVPIHGVASLRKAADHGCRAGVLEEGQGRRPPWTMRQGRAGCGCMAADAVAVAADDDSLVPEKGAFRP
jgi:hypothetical protein